MIDFPRPFLRERMRVAAVALVALCAAAASAFAASGADTSAPSHGWGDDIEWHSTLAEAEAASAESGKPVMTVIHKSWCGACKSLRPKFAESKEIATLSASFEMFNSLDGDEPTGDGWAPDGGYIPRVLFSAPGESTPDAELINPGKRAGDQYQYFYPAADQIVAGMRAAKAKLTVKDAGKKAASKEEL
jgi:protein-disulfide reductase (glutathione)